MSKKSERSNGYAQCTVSPENVRGTFLSDKPATGKEVPILLQNEDLTKHQQRHFQQPPGRNA